MQSLNYKLSCNFCLHRGFNLTKNFKQGEKMLVKELNIKQDMPPCDVAVAIMEMEIEALSSSEYGAIKVIHGYGSHGKGGMIRTECRQRLATLKHQNKILDYVEGERWGKWSIEKFDVVKNFPSLILEGDMQGYNSGITIVFLKQN